MKVLALDLGTKTGWAISSGTRLQSSGMQEQKNGRYDGGGMRYLRFRRWLGEMWTLQAFERIYFEEVRNHKGVDAAHVYGGLLAHLTAWCEEQKPPIPYEGIPVGTIKKHATGKGNTKKAGMKIAAARLWNSPDGYYEDDNEADALCLLHYAVNVLEPAPAKRQRIRAL